jgi:hypothetical protein
MKKIFLLFSLIFIMTGCYSKIKNYGIVDEVNKGSQCFCFVEIEEYNGKGIVEFLWILCDKDTEPRDTIYFGGKN